MTVAALLLCLSGFARRRRMPAPAAAPDAAAAAAQRDLWLADEGRYVRRWLLLGPLSPAQADELAKTGTPTALGDVAPGSGQRFAGNDTAVWREQTTYGDILDGFSAAGMKNGDIGLALAVVERPAAGEAALLLGGNVRGVWVNGAWVDGRGAGGGENSPAFAIDGTELRVPMNAGQNRILLRVERLDRPAPLTLRAVSPGFVGQVAGGISPHIGSEAGGVLRIFPGARPTRNALKIRYEVIAPGGRVVAEATTSRNQPHEFKTAQWQDGPYEVRVMGSNSLGDPVYVHLPWFKGDANAAVQRLLAGCIGRGQRRRSLENARRHGARPRRRRLACAALAADGIRRSCGSSARARTGGLRGPAASCVSPGPTTSMARRSSAAPIYRASNVLPVRRAIAGADLPARE